MNHDVVIVGGSFAGLSAALQLARARRHILVVDSGQLRNRFAQLSHGFFGQDGKPPSAILAIARAQLLSYPTVRFAEALATHASRTDHEFSVELDGGEIHTASNG
jgi:thioredoxin reductase